MADDDPEVHNLGLRRIAPKPEMSTPHSFFDYPLAPSDTNDSLTPADKLFVLAHLGVPKIDPVTWTLEFTGLIEKPLLLSLDELGRYPKKHVKAVHHCAGDPMDSTIRSRAVANVEWGGVLLRDILSDLAVSESCTHLWAFGLDFGSYIDLPIEQEHYIQDIPLSYVMTADVLIATELNGTPLSEKHGFPARLVVPGFYASNSVKWLCRIELSDRHAQGLFTSRLYTDHDPTTGASERVWKLSPGSTIVSPATESTVADGTVKISGWAWSFSEVTQVEVSVNGGESWSAADVETREGLSWQRFTYSWLPERTGRFRICCRATDADGKSQPLELARNSVHIIEVSVDRG